MIRTENLKSSSTRRLQIVFSSVLASVGESDYQFAHVTHIYLTTIIIIIIIHLRLTAIRAWDTLEIVREEIILLNSLHLLSQTVSVTIVNQHDFCRVGVFENGIL